MVRVSLAGIVLAESRRARAPFETSLPIRWYLPRDDVRFELLEESPTVTRCAYKDTARHWSAHASGEVVTTSPGATSIARPRAGR